MEQITTATATATALAKIATSRTGKVEGHTATIANLMDAGLVRQVERFADGTARYTLTATGRRAYVRSLTAAAR